ncbi:MULTISPECIES: contact-dependent growth inhibition system immunity protein [Hyphomonas]|uniref:contact-dependent growth inhibition system immunity protein n=1 Tax=Hyphomonas TaxID=85 RepID=UPI00067426BC|nr:MULTISPECIES: contact-dependent growth inhibition system immunity protein [Hyphomonas]
MPTLEELSGTCLPDPGPDATALVRRCSVFARTELAELSDEGVRTLVGQQMFLQWLLPVALERLSHDLWISGDFYRGALLRSAVGSVAHADASTFVNEIRSLARAALADDTSSQLPDDVKADFVRITELFH